MKWALSNVNRDDNMCEKDNPNSKNKNHTYTIVQEYKTIIHCFGLHIVQEYKTILRQWWWKKKLVLKEPKRDQFWLLWAFLLEI